VRGFAKVRGEWSLMALSYNLARVLSIVGLDDFVAHLAKRAGERAALRLQAVAAALLRRAKAFLGTLWGEIPPKCAFAGLRFTPAAQRAILAQPRQRDCTLRMTGAPQLCPTGICPRCIPRLLEPPLGVRRSPASCNMRPDHTDPRLRANCYVLVSFKRAGGQEMNAVAFGDWLRKVTDIMRATGEIDDPWLETQWTRYAETFRTLARYDGPTGAALEIGVTKLFQYILSAELGFARSYGTEFRRSDEPLATKIDDLDIVGHAFRSHVLRVNLEHDPIPLADASLDLVLCCEVVEHMDIDPMFMVAELNRVLRPDGRLLLTTPNSTSSQNVWNVLQGYRPQFFMNYTRDRSPYRHNYEHDIHSVLALTKASGFETISIETIDTFAKPRQDALDALKALGCPLQHRGDNIFYWGRKVSGVVERWPAEIYA
jgi:SAM-dependent methyltransferase